MKKNKVKRTGMSDFTVRKTMNELSAKVTNWMQFNHCNAYISNCIDNRFFLIKSYNTIVGIVDDQQGEIFEVGKYSRTTSKQFTQIHNQMFSDCNRFFVELN